MKSFSVINNNAQINSNTTIKGDLNVNGDVIANNFTSRNLNVSNNLNVSSDVFLSSNLGVTGNVNLKNNLDVYGTLGVTGITNLKNILNVSSDTFISGSLGVTGAVNFKNNLDVSGSTNLKSNLDVSGSLGVTGISTFYNDMNIIGTVCVTGPSFIYNVLTVTTDTFINGNLEVSEIGGFKNLVVDNNAYVNNNLGVTGIATFKNDVNIIGSLGVTGITYLHNQLNVSSDVNMDGSLGVSGISTFHNKILANQIDSLSDTLNIGNDNCVTANIACGNQTQTVNIGSNSSSGNTTINIGGAGDTVNIAGSLNYIQSTNLQVSDKNITLNKGGTSSSSIGSGIDIEENGSVQGYIRIGNNRDNWEFKSTNNNNKAFLKPISDSFILLDTDTSITNINNKIVQRNNTGDINISTLNSTNINNSNDVNIVGSLGVTGITNLRNNLNVYNDVYISGSLGITGSVDLKNNLNVSGSTNLKSNLDVSGIATFKNNVNIIGSLGVTGITYLHNQLNVSSDVNITGNLINSGHATFNDKIITNNINSLNDTINIGESSNFINIGIGNNSKTINIGNQNDIINILGNVNNIQSTNLQVFDKNIQLNSQSVGNGTSIDAGIYVRDNNNNQAGYIKIGNNGDNWEFKAPQNNNIVKLNPISNSFIILDHDVSVNNNNNKIVQRNNSGDINISTLNSSNINNSNNAYIYGSLGVTGNVNLKNDLYVSGSLGVTGAVHLNDVLNVSGLTNLKSNLDVNGNLGVTGAVNFKNDLDVTGSLGVTGDVNLKNNLDVNGSLGVTGISTFYNKILTNQIDSISNTLNIGNDNCVTANIACGNQTQIVNIGSNSSTGNTTINIGGPSDSVNIAGSLNFIQSTNLQVTDKNIILNKGGASGSGSGSGIDIEENGSISAYIRQNSNRSGFEFKSSNVTSPFNLELSSLNEGLLKLNESNQIISSTGTINDIQNLQSTLDSKADSSTVNSQLALKADSSTVNTQLNTKANLSGGNRFNNNQAITDNNTLVGIFASSTLPADANPTNNFNVPDAFTISQVGGNGIGKVNLQSWNTRPLVFNELGNDTLVPNMGSSPSSVVNKQYADTKASLSGATFTGVINMNSTNKIINVVDPTNAQDVATKKYTDDQLATKANLLGATFTGAINMNSTNKIINVANPTNPQDAATKKYTDDQLALKADSSTVNTQLATKADLSGATFTGPINVANDSNLNNVNVNGTLGVTGISTFYDNLNIIGTVCVTGPTYIYDVLTVSTDTYITGNLEVSEFGGFKNLAIDNNAYINNTLGVTGIATFKNSVNIVGSLGVTGITNLYNDLNVNNNLYINGSLGVTGISNFYNNINMGSNKIISSATPSTDNDLTNKKYTDDQLATKANLSGANFTGAINMGSNIITSSSIPSNDNELTNKKYVDDGLNTKFNKSGGTITATTTISADSGVFYLNKNNNTIQNYMYFGESNGQYQNLIECSGNSGQTILLGNQGSFDMNIITNTGKINIAPNISKKIEISSNNMNMLMPIQMNDNKITSSATPSTVNDLTNKKYVDDQLALKADLSGATFTGNLTIGSISSGYIGPKNLDIYGKAYFRNSNNQSQYILIDSDLSSPNKSIKFIGDHMNLQGDSSIYDFTIKGFNLVNLNNRFAITRDYDAIGIRRQNDTVAQYISFQNQSAGVSYGVIESAGSGGSSLFDLVGAYDFNIGSYGNGGATNIFYKTSTQNGGLRIKVTNTIKNYVDVDMSNKLIQNLADPTSNQDAATKKYIDDKLALKADSSALDNKVDLYTVNLYLATKANLSGATFTGALLSDNGIASLGTIAVKNSYATPTQYIQFERDIAYTQNGNDGNNGNGYRFDGQNSTGHFTFKGYNNFVLEQPLNMNSTNKIINVADPINPQDAATKKYTDDQLATKADSSTVTTQLATKADSSTVTTQLATKADSSTVTTQLATKANLSGATFSGSIDMGSNKIINVANPTNPQDAATKKYTDDQLVLKADSSTVTTQLAQKANTTDVNNELALKANTTYVNNELALKANTTDVNNKADLSYVNNLISSGTYNFDVITPAAIDFNDIFHPEWDFSSNFTMVGNYIKIGNFVQAFLTMTFNITDYSSYKDFYIQIAVPNNLKFKTNSVSGSFTKTGVNLASNNNKAVIGNIIGDPTNNNNQNLILISGNSIDHSYHLNTYQYSTSDLYTTIRYYGKSVLKVDLRYELL